MKVKDLSLACCKVLNGAAFAIAGLSILALSTNAFALERPNHSQADHRIQYVDYSKDDVVRVNAANGFITTIVFAPGEKVINYGSGYSTAWEFATADNQFFLKPKDKEGTTNIVVVTNKRIYSFDVFLVEKAANATYKLTFRYPQDYLEAKIKEGQEQYIKDQLEKEDPNLMSSLKDLNYNYTMNFGKTLGSRLIAPIACYDNGRFTYMKFRPNTDFPAVYSVSADGEAIVNSHIENNVLVIHSVYPELRLRAGSDVVGIYNNTKHGIVALNDDGTTVPGLTRELKE